MPKNIKLQKAGSSPVCLFTLLLLLSPGFLQCRLFINSAFANNSSAPKQFTNTNGMKMLYIPEGTFQMGSGKDFNDKPVRRVVLTKPYYIAAYEVTQAQFKKIMGYNPSWLSYNRSEYPASCVSWFEAVEFCNKLSEKEGKQYRLPTEAEWEYAARAGTETDFFFGEDKSELNEYAWTHENAKTTKPVGHLKPNPWGLYDIYGNVYEWVSDWYAHDSYSRIETEAPKGVERKEGRTGGKAARGGCFLGSCGMNSLRTERCSSTARNCWTPYAKHRAVGFRVVCEYQEK